MASKLDQWLATLSRGTLATLAIAGGILFIILSDPPKSVCDVQVKQAKDNQIGFLFPNTKVKGAPKVASVGQLFDYCERGNGPGACYELFAKVKSLVRDLEAVPPECSSEAASVSEFKKILWATTRLMVQAAWGKAPPASYMEKFGWLDAADVALFCRMKAQIVRLYGQASWESYREGLFRDLPGAKDLPRKDAWERLLLSEDCKRY